MLFNIYLDIDACALNFSYLVKNKACFSLNQNDFGIMYKEEYVANICLHIFTPNTSLIYSRKCYYM